MRDKQVSCGICLEGSGCWDPMEGTLGGCYWGGSISIDRLQQA
jgi:hypothetical protein